MSARLSLACSFFVEEYPSNHECFNIEGIHENNRRAKLFIFLSIAMFILIPLNNVENTNDRNVER
jgi:hypothetical protein